MTIDLKAEITYNVVQQIYNATIRDYLPRRWQVADDITIRTGRLFDTSRAPQFEALLRSGIRQTVNTGDTVVVVGGGFGSSTVEATRAAGQDGEVVVYEAVGEQLNLLKQTVTANHTPADVTIHHARVGAVSDRSQEGYGPPDGGVIKPSELPEADVYVLDCEGAEDEIVPELDDGELVLETHAWGDLDPYSLENWTASIEGVESDTATVWTLEATNHD